MISVVSKGSDVSWLLTVEHLDLADRKPLQLLTVFYAELLLQIKNNKERKKSFHNFDMGAHSQNERSCWYGHQN